MPVDFDIASLNINNFRGIRELAIEFAPKEVTYLIGPNNSCKSTVINGIALALRGGGFHAFHPEEFDFHHHADGTQEVAFEIQLRFTAGEDMQLPAVQGVGPPTLVFGIRVAGNTDKKGHHSHSHALMDKDYKPITLSHQTPLKKEDKEKFRDHDVGWRLHYARPDDIRGHMPDVWLLRADNLTRSLYDWRTGPLQQLARLLTERFVREEWQFVYNGEPRAMPKTMKNVHGFFQRAVSEFPFWKEDMQPKLQEALSSYLGRQARIFLYPTIHALEEWLAQQLAVSFASDGTGALTPLRSMGDGWQSLVRVAALDVLRRYPDACGKRVALLYEEPETYLHPHLRRKLRGVLQDLASLGWFIVCSTHAPEFIQFSERQSVIRLYYDAGRLSKGCLTASSIDDEAKAQERLDERGNHEMLFANRVVLCEGKDDCYAVESFLRKHAVDTDGLSVSFLDTGGHRTLPSYCRIANAVGIPWCAITDEDRLDAKAPDPNTESTRAKIEKLKRPGDAMQFWPGNLEKCLGVPAGKKATPRWQMEHLDPLTKDDMVRKHPEFAGVCGAIQSWIADVAGERNEKS